MIAIDIEKYRPQTSRWERFSPCCSRPENCLPKQTVLWYSTSSGGRLPNLSRQEWERERDRESDEKFRPTFLTPYLPLILHLGEHCVCCFFFYFRLLRHIFFGNCEYTAHSLPNTKQYIPNGSGPLSANANCCRITASSRSRTEKSCETWMIIIIQIDNHFSLLLVVAQNKYYVVYVCVCVCVFSCARNASCCRRCKFCFFHLFCCHSQQRPQVSSHTENFAIFPQFYFCC